MQRLTIRQGTESTGASIWATLAAPILRYRRITYVVVTTSVAVTIVVSLFLKNRYTSTAVILPNSGRMQSSALSRAVGSLAEIGLGSELRLDQNSTPLYSEILSSRWIADRMLETAFADYCDPELRNAKLETYLDVANRDRAIRRLSSMVQVDTDRRTGTTRVSVTTTCAELSAAMTHAYVAALDDWNVNQRRSSAGETMAFIAARAEEKLKDLEEAEEQLRAFQAANRNFLTSSDPDILLEQARYTRNVELHSRLYLALMNEYQQARLETAKDIPVIQILDRGSVPMEKSGPRRTYYVMGSLVGSLFFSILLSLWLELSAKRHGSGQSGQRVDRGGLHLSRWEEGMYRRLCHVGGRLQALADVQADTADERDVSDPTEAKTRE